MRSKDEIKVSKAEGKADDEDEDEDEDGEDEDEDESEDEDGGCSRINQETFVELTRSPKVWVPLQSADSPDWRQNLRSRTR